MWETLFVAPTAPHLWQVWILIVPIVPPLATLYEVCHFGDVQ
jgi:hypothetical protein